MTSITEFMLIIINSTTAGVGNSLILETKDKNYKDFQKFQFLYMWLAGWCTVSLFCLYQPFMKLWVGDELMFNSNIMSIFCIYFFVTKMGDVCYMYRQAAGLWWQDKLRPIVESVLNLTLNIIFVKIWGVSGVLLSTIFSLIIISTIWGSKILFNNYFTEQNQIIYLCKLVYFAIATLSTCIITNYICNLFYLNNFFRLAINTVICIIIPNIILGIFYFPLHEYKSSVQFIKELIKK